MRKLFQASGLAAEAGSGASSARPAKAVAAKVVVVRVVRADRDGMRAFSWRDEDRPRPAGPRFCPEKGESLRQSVFEGRSGPGALPRTDGLCGAGDLLIVSCLTFTSICREARR
ncbi:hypothetical protein GCM10011335_12500 [Aureimonas glaciei]|uniref:Uncharacterized protein n=1 Tax=Aureimonas glaciei TaxID=1776957 RepID=A0A916XU39_9HYPH|nr:hypothetical protein GCM10011335_12500 [Aureimonas glaciei]